MSDAAVEERPKRGKRQVSRPEPKVDRSGLRYVDKIVMRNVAELKENPRNSRTHSQEQVDVIAALITKFGFTVPILIDSDDVMWAGHGRKLGALKLGMRKVPTIDVSYLSEDEKRALMVADNAVPMAAGWDLNALVPELDAMKAGGLDLAALGMASLYDLVPKEPEEEQAAPRNRRAQSSGTGMVIQYNIVFDDVDQQQAWFRFLRGLKAKYADAETIGARLARFIGEQPQ